MIDIDFYNEGIGFKNATTVYTNIDGMAYVYLIPNKIYSFNITASGYDNYYTSFMISPLREGYEFRLESSMDDFEFMNETDFHSDIRFNGHIQGTNLFVNYTDYDTNTSDTNIYVYEINSTLGNLSLFGTDYRLGDNNFQVTFTGINITNCYQVILFLNHSTYGFHRMEFILCADVPGRNITSKTIWDTLFDNNFGGNPFGWSNTFAFFIMVATCFSFGQRNSGVGMMITGGVLVAINSIIGLNLINGTIPILFIGLGVLVQWSNHRREG